MKTLLPLLLLCSCLSAADLSEAKALLDARKNAEAKSLLEKIVLVEPKNIDALYYLGMSYRRLGEVDAAFEKLQLAADLAPKRTEVLIEYATLAGELCGKRKSISLAYKSRDTLEYVLKLDDKNLKAREWLIGFYSGAPWIVGGSMKKAFAHAKVLAEQDEPRGFFWMVQLNLKEKDYDKAFDVCERAQKKVPDHYLALYHFGRCSAESGLRIAEGKAALERCLKMPFPARYPGHDQVFLQLGLIARRQGDAKAATGFFEEGLKENPKNAALQKELAVKL